MAEEENKTESKVEEKEEIKAEAERGKEEKTSKSAVEKAKEKLDEIKKGKKETKEKEPKIILEREYIVPLRRGWIKTSRYRRAKRAVKVLKEFLAKHMKVEERDLRKVKIDLYLNNELWFRGIKKPHAKIKVKAIKKDNGIVYAELAEIPEAVKWKMQKAVKIEKEKKAKPEKKEEKTEEEKKEEQEKEKAVVEAGLKMQKQEAKTMKHTSKAKQPKQAQIQRKALKK